MRLTELFDFTSKAIKLSISEGRETMSKSEKVSGRYYLHVRLAKKQADIMKKLAEHNSRSVSMEANRAIIYYLENYAEIVRESVSNL